MITALLMSLAFCVPKMYAFSGEEDELYKEFQSLDEAKKREIINKIRAERGEPSGAQQVSSRPAGTEAKPHQTPTGTEQVPPVSGGIEGKPYQAVPQPPKGPVKEAELPSNIENILSGQFPVGIMRDLRQYGYDFFNNGAAFTQPANVPVGDDYIIGPGDQFTINLWGKTENAYDVTVSRDGTIVVPRLGGINVSGLTFLELKNLLQNKFKEYYPDFNMSVTMGNLRTIEVFIVGEANKPATYSLNSLSTVVTALYAAGGPSKNGSLRDIRVFRNGRLIANLDLYEFFINGMKDNDIRLQTGDTIFIPVVESAVGVAGSVRRPAIYEMIGEQSIGEVIELAGGLLPTGELQNVVVERIEGNQRREIKSFNLDPSSSGTNMNLNLPLKNFDVIKIYPIHGEIRHVVYLEGHVKYPREYELRPGMRILDIITSFNSLLPEPYLPQAEIIRLVPPDNHPEIVPFNLGALMSGQGDQNLPLQDQDRIIIYDKWQKKERPRVTINGEVRAPGTYMLCKGMTVKDLIFQAGNLTDDAYLEKATLSRVTPESTGTGNREYDFSPKKAMSGHAPDNLVLEKDDSVMIRTIPQYRQALERKIYLEGEILFPGEYSFSEGDRLAGVIEKAGGLTKRAYPFGASFYRESVKKVQEKQLQDYVSRLEEEILTMSSQEAGLQDMDKDEAAAFAKGLETKKQLLKKLKEAKVTGRMVISLPEILADPSSRENLELMAGDRLVVNERPDVVNVMGEVYNPTAILVAENRPVKYYLNQVGGITSTGDKANTYVVKADGTVISKRQESFFGMATWDSSRHWWALGFESVRLDPGDTIIVPKEVEKSPWMKTTRDFTQILYQIAVGAGVIVAAY